MVSSSNSTSGSRTTFRFWWTTTAIGTSTQQSLVNLRDTWADKDAKGAQARKLAAMFAENYRDFADDVPPAVRDAGPPVG